VKDTREAERKEEVIDALRVAVENGTRLRDTTSKRQGKDASGPWITPWALAERTLGVKPAEAKKIQRELETSGVLRRRKVRDAAGKRAVEEFELAREAYGGNAVRKAADAGLQSEF
jgi:hypothetical protein